MGACCTKKKESSFQIVHYYSLHDYNIPRDKYNRWFCEFCHERIIDNFLTIAKCIHCNKYIGHASCISNSWPDIHIKKECPLCNQ